MKLTRRPLNLFVPICAISLGAFFGCNWSPPEGSPSTCAESAVIPTSVATDILFVIDDSRSMAAAQQKVVDQLESFVEMLSTSPLHNDFQIGVITTTVSMNVRGCDPSMVPIFEDFPEHSGRLQRGKDLWGSELDPTDPKIVRFDDPELLPRARSLLGQGIAGAGQEMGFEAMRLALSEPLISTPLDAPDPGNQSFLRDGARLLVVIVSDEDDCSDPTGTAIALQPACGEPCQDDDDCGLEGHYCLSASGGRCHANHCETPGGRALLEPVRAYVDFLLDMKDGMGRAREVFLAVIGAVDPEDPLTAMRCGDSEGRGVRYLEAIGLMGERGYVDSICRDDFAEPMEKIAELLDAPQLLTLEAEPMDPRLLEVRVNRVDGTVVPCRLGEGFAFHPPSGDVPARIEMLQRCRLRYGDDISVKLYCAG